MPMYEYVCATCRHEFEQIQRFTDEALTECPECGGAVRRVISSVGIIFKGSGWYINDSRRQITASKSKDIGESSKDGTESSNDVAESAKDSSEPAKDGDQAKPAAAGDAKGDGTSGAKATVPATDKKAAAADGSSQKRKPSPKESAPAGS